MAAPQASNRWSRTAGSRAAWSLRETSFSALSVLFTGAVAYDQLPEFSLPQGVKLSGTRLHGRDLLHGLPTMEVDKEYLMVEIGRRVPKRNRCAPGCDGNE